MALFIDVECYKNYFLFCAKNDKTSRVTKIPMHEGCELKKDLLQKIMVNETTISFNGNKYDLLIIGGALKGWSCEKLHELSNEIIQSDKNTYQILSDNNLRLPTYNHIDLIEVAISQASLKLYGGRLHTKKLQDLPINPQSLISPEQREILSKYCENDLELTELLYNKLKPQIDLRTEMKSKYGMDLRSKSDAQIAETIIKSELSSTTNAVYKPKEYEEGFTFNYNNPNIIDFKSDELTSIYNNLLQEKFTLSDSGSVKMPEWLSKQKITIGDTVYKMGIGGLHSCEKKQFKEEGNGYLLSDYDVTSFYPSIILQQELYPESMGEEFLALYQSIVDRRIFAKKMVSELQCRIETLEREIENAITKKTL